MEVQQQSREQSADAIVRVLITDDHPLWRERVRRILEKESGILIVGEAQDGEEAMEMCEQLSPDVVLMDIHMPRVDGLQATRALQQQMPHVRVLLFSMSRDARLAEQGIGLGAMAYWSKESNPDELVSLIRAIISGDGQPGSASPPSPNGDTALL